jgi:hypothetical protein
VGDEAVHAVPDRAMRPLTEAFSLRGWGKALTVVLFTAPVAAYFWLIHRYALNIVYYDQWSDVRLVAHPTFGALWAQHNENRIFFPNLVVLLLAHTTHLNIIDEEFLSASMLVVATALIALAHRRRASETPWFAYIPLVLLLFSFVQDGDTLWGFQLAWYMVLLALAGCVYLLDRPNLSRLVFAAAVVIAVVGSFSSLQGLLIWPVGVLLNFQRRRRGVFQLGWIVSAAVTIATYLYGLNFSKANPGGTFALTHLGSSLRFFFTAIGNIFGGQVIQAGVRVPGAPNLGTGGTVVLGTIVFVLAVLTIVVFGARRDETTAGPIGVALVLFGLLFAASLTTDRSSAAWGAGLSRYTTFDLLILAGCYLAMLGRPLTERRSWIPAARAIIVGLVALQVVVGTIEGIAYARTWERHEIAIANITENIDSASNVQIGAEVYPGAEYFPWFVAEIRQWVHLAEDHHLSQFADKKVAGSAGSVISGP